MSLDVVTLPDFKSLELPSIEDSTSYPLFSQWIKSDENALLNTTSLEGSETCASIDSGRLPIEWDGDANGAPAGSTLPGTFGSIFAKSTDANTREEVVFLYDRHLTFYENTVENPVSCLACVITAHHLPELSPAHKTFFLVSSYTAC